MSLDITNVLRLRDDTLDRKRTVQFGARWVEFILVILTELGKSRWGKVMIRVAVAFASLPAASADAAQLLTPNMIRHDIAQYGAKAVVNKLYEADAWDQVKDRISAGSAGWIRPALALSDGTDAATSEELGESLIPRCRKRPRPCLPLSISAAADTGHGEWTKCAARLPMRVIPPTCPAIVRA